jgi:hypothetical protein
MRLPAPVSTVFGLQRTEPEPSARRVVSLDVRAWTADEPTRLLTGTTLVLGTEDALLRLPMLPAETVRMTLRIALPDRAVLTRASVAARTGPDLAEVVFDELGPYERSRIRTFIHAAE